MDESATKRFLPWLVATVLFMDRLDSTIVNPCIPAMAAGLGATPLSLKAVVSSYLLSMAVGIPASGWLAERYGSRRAASYCSQAARRCFPGCSRFSASMSWTRFEWSLCWRFRLRCSPGTAGMRHA